MFLEERNRRVLPRWRDFKTTLLLRELENQKQAAAVSPEDERTLHRRSEEFNEQQTVWHAGDLLSSAFVVGQGDGLKEAATFLISHRASVPKPLLSLAESVLRTEEPTGGLDVEPMDEEELSRAVHRVRQRLREEPRNAIQWAELSRLHVLLGKRDRALRSMRIASVLGPDNRFIVRSAARLFLHEHDPSMALRVIRRASGANSDPWLLAAEIAVSSACKSPSMLAKAGRMRNEDEALSPFDRTELASALGTIELENGKHRKARQLFRSALTAPNENSVAQVEWANRQIGGLEIETASVGRVPRLFEASAQLSLISGDWSRAIRLGEKWLHDQPFSKRPAVFTSYVNSVVGQYSKSVEILRASLKVNPSDEMLLNNLAFALASENRIPEAVEVLKGADYTTATSVPAITLAATHGLVLFRTGFPERGRALYQLAIERAGKLGIRKYQLMANLYLAREELLAETPNASAYAYEALASIRDSSEKDVLLVADQLRNVLRKRSVGAGRPS